MAGLREKDAKKIRFYGADHGVFYQHIYAHHVDAMALSRSVAKSHDHARHVY
jgi:hypothetical protein